MAEPLRRTVDATPAPARGLAVGDCARDCGVFAGGVRRGRVRSPTWSPSTWSARLPAGAGGDRRGPARGDRPVTAVDLSSGLAAQLVLAARRRPGRRARAPAAAPRSCWPARLRGARRRRGRSPGLAAARRRLRGRRCGSRSRCRSPPLGPLVLAPDPLGGLFLALAGAVGALAALFGIGYAHGAGGLAHRLGGVRGVPAGHAAGPGRGRRRHVPAGLGADGGRLDGARARRPPPASRRCVGAASGTR